MNKKKQYPRKLSGDIFIKKGFSLIELLIVISLVALVCMLTFGTAHLYQNAELSNQINELFILCKYQQQKAIVTNSIQKIIINPFNNSYSYNTVTHQLPSSIQFGFKKGVKGPPAYPKKCIKKSVTFCNKTIICYPSGIINAGTIYLTDSKNNHMYALSNAVSQVSFLRKYQYANKWQLQ